MSKKVNAVFRKYQVDSAVRIRYIFMDIVRFSYGRPVEAQTEIICRFNKLVDGSVRDRIESEEDYIYLPTGDGVCIAILNTDLELDIPIDIALDIISKIAQANEEENDNARRFYVRIGINENIDNIVIDINNRPNVVGAGINEAQRIMDIGEAGQIFVGRSSYDVLRQRKRFSSAFNEFREVQVKHDIKLDVYQYIADKHGLVTSPPTHLVQPQIESAFSKKR